MIGRFLFLRGVQIVITMAVLIVATFVIMRIAPGSPAEVLLGPDQVSDERIASIEHSLGLDRSIPEQVALWTGRVAQGDLGTSYFYRQPAIDVVLERLPATLILGGTSLFVAIAVGIPAGIWAAAHRDGWIDRGVRSAAVIVMSTPAFWLGIGLIFVFSARLGILPSSGTGEVLGSASLADRLRHLVLPVTAMALPFAATFALFTRGSLEDVLDADFLRTARAKGLKEQSVLWGHAIRNAAIPVTVQIGLSLPHVLEGSVVVESVFSWPGIGQLTVQSVGRRDYPVLLAIVLLVGFVVLLSSLLTDLVHRLIDPRVDLA